MGAGSEWTYATGLAFISVKRMLSLHKRKTGRQKYKNEIFCSDHLHVFFLPLPVNLGLLDRNGGKGHRRGGFRLARCAGKQSSPPLLGQKAMSAICITATLAEIHMAYLLTREVGSFAASEPGPGCPKCGIRRKEFTVALQFPKIKAIPAVHKARPPGHHSD